MKFEDVLHNGKLWSVVYDLITGGAIKLTPSMQDREHTLYELKRMETVRNYLIDNGIIDRNGLIDYIKEG